MQCQGPGLIQPLLSLRFQNTALIQPLSMPLQRNALYSIYKKQLTLASLLKVRKTQKLPKLQPGLVLLLLELLDLQIQTRLGTQTPESQLPDTYSYYTEEQFLRNQLNRALLLYQALKRSILHAPKLAKEAFWICKLHAEIKRTAVPKLQDWYQHETDIQDQIRALQITTPPTTTPYQNPQIILANNQGVIKLLKNPQHHNRTKHINVRHHFI